MTRNITRLLCAFVGAGVVFTAGAAAGAQKANRFQRVQLPAQLAIKAVPRSMDRTPVTVVAILAGPSVANVQEAAGRKLSRAERLTVKADRRGEQSGKRAQIEAAGGRVVGSFQSAVNGLKVRIPKNQVESLRQIPGVVNVLRVGVYSHENAVSVPRIGTPLAWAGVNGVRGEGIKIAILDTGIDYTHANFGGPGTPAAFDAAFAADTLPADPALFGPNAPKVKGGIDLVGDDYDANVAGSLPVPDPNPLDCNGHGSHVAGSAAGFGVLANGSEYTGCVRSTHAQQQLPDRSGCRSEGRSLCRACVRLRGIDRCRDRGHRMGHRQRHGRHQHVLGLQLRPRRHRGCIGCR